MTLNTVFKTTSVAATAAAFAVLLGAAVPAQASDDDCRSVPQAEWRPTADAIAAVQAQGYEVRQFEVDDGCYEVHAVGKSGERVKLYLDPGSLQIVRTKGRS